MINGVYSNFITIVKATCCLLFVTFFAVMNHNLVHAQTSPSVFINGAQVSFEQPPVLLNDRVFVPLRGISEGLDAQTQWNSETRSITITKDSKIITLTVGDIKADIGGNPYILDVAPYVSDKGRTLVPLRFISEAFDIKVNWKNGNVFLGDGAFSEADMALIIAGTKWTVMADAADLIKIMGSKVEVSESISCAYDGMDKMYKNGDFAVLTLPINGKNSQIVDEIFLISDKYSTVKGITVGSSMDDVRIAYGNDYTEDEGRVTFWAGEEGDIKTPQLYFEIEDEKIVILGIYGARNAG